VTKRDAQRIGGAVADKLHTPRERDVAKLAERVPPQNPDAEAAVLGSMLLANECIGEVGQALGAEDFYSPENQVIYAAMLDLYEHNKPADVLTVLDALGEGADGSYLKDLLGAVPSAANAMQYAAIVKDRATLRAMIGAQTDGLKDAYGGEGEADAVLDRAQQRLFALADRRTSNDTVSVASLLAGARGKIEQIRDGSWKPGITTGFIGLDHNYLHEGLGDGELVVLMGRPSSGKTTFALNLLEHVSIGESKPSVIFSLEMSKERLVQNFLVMRSGVSLFPAERILAAREYDMLDKATNDLDAAPIHLNDTPGLTLMQLRAKIRQLVQRKGVRLVVVDYLQLMTPPSGETRNDQIGAISRGLKLIAREVKVPILVLSQMNRSSESRQDARPRLSDLRDSGNIEQDADIVLGMYRPEVYDPTPDNQNIVEVLVLKQRNGPTGVAKLQFAKSLYRFRALARGEA